MFHRKFFLKRYINEVYTFIKAARNLEKRSGSENEGFVKIAEKLDQLIQSKVSPSCRFCNRFCNSIGDSIIALEAQKNMLLDHTDFSFNHLCAHIGQPHHCHPSEISFLKKQMII